MMKLEMHCHTAGSWCALSTPEKAVLEYKQAGYDGLVVTNHYAESEMIRYNLPTKEEYAKYYLGLIDDVIEMGKKYDLKVFFGAEVTLKNENKAEYLLYGFDRQFLLDHPNLFDLTQIQLFALAEEYGLFMAQAHPFRKNVKLGDPKYMHGVESFNGHFHHDSHNDLAIEFAEKNNLIRICGTDYHDPEQPKTTGVFVPDTIKEEKQLADYLLKNEHELDYDEEKYTSWRIKYFKEMGWL